MTLNKTISAPFKNKQLAMMLEGPRENGESININTLEIDGKQLSKTSTSQNLTGQKGYLNQDLDQLT
jgi:hypothetical protein